MFRVSRGWGLSILALTMAAGLALAGCEKKEEAQKPAEEMGAPAPEAAPSEAEKPMQAPSGAEQPMEAPSEGEQPTEAPKPGEPPSE